MRYHNIILRQISIYFITLHNCFLIEIVIYINLRNTIQEFEYDREYQNAILASIQEFDGNSDTINSLEHENDIYTPLDVFDEMVLENISSDSDSDSDNDPMNQVD